MLLCSEVKNAADVDDRAWIIHHPAAAAAADMSLAIERQQVKHAADSGSSTSAVVQQCDVADTKHGQNCTTVITAH